jgi:hypothetical protein
MVNNIILLGCIKIVMLYLNNMAIFLITKINLKLKKA